jgi:hypothetical protein
MNLQEAISEAEIWNSNNPVGTRVEVTHGDGSMSETETFSRAFMFGGCAAVRLEGMIGWFELHRVRPIPRTKTKESE